MGRTWSLPAPYPLRGPVPAGRGAPSPEELRAALWRWLDRIPDELVAGGHSLLFGAWLRALGLHDRYSFQNRALVAMQAPKTPAVGSKSWWKRQGREVFEGAEPVYLLAYEGRDQGWSITEVYRLEDTAGEPYAPHYLLTQELVEALTATLRLPVFWDEGPAWRYDPEGGKLVLGRAMPPADALEVALVANEDHLLRAGALRGDERLVRTAALAAATAFLVRFGVDRTPSEREAGHDPEVSQRLARFRELFARDRRGARKAIEAALGRIEALWNALIAEAAG